MERWKNVPDFPNYEVSNRGRVRSKRRVVTNSLGAKRTYPAKLLKQSMLQGYLRVTLYDNTKRRRKNPVAVHKLVLRAFRGLPPASEGQTDSRHLDGDPTNNRLGNLRYGTQQVNSDDRTRHGRVPVGESNGKSKLTKKVVRKLRRDFRRLGSYAEAARRSSVKVDTARDAIVGRTWKHLT